MLKRWLAPILALSLTTWASAEKLNPPLPATIIQIEGPSLQGKILSYDTECIEFQTGARTVTIAWTNVQPRVAMSLCERLFVKGTAQQWLTIGSNLLKTPGGKSFADRAFARALRLDAKIKPQIDAAKSEITSGTSLTRAGIPASQPSTATSTWGTQTDDEMRAAVAEIKADIEQRLRKSGLNVPLVVETDYFLFYSNLTSGENRQWAALLDRMYNRVAEIFGIPKGKNIWRGKAAIVCFRNDEEFAKFERESYQHSAHNAVGVCHSFHNGDVHAVFRRGRDDQYFARTLVHETTHGFLHRYRSPVQIPNWLNEGLAEVMEFELVVQPGLKQAEDADARNELRRPNPLDNFFTSTNIHAHQYPIARTLTEFMIRQNKQGYVEFINAIKDGEPWREALKNKYGVELEPLLRAYGATMGVPGLQP